MRNRSDDELLSQISLGSGVASAGAELWARHRIAAIAYATARGLSHPRTSAVAAFKRAIRSMREPASDPYGFRALLLITLNDLVIDEVQPPDSKDATAALRQTVTMRVFSELPRQQRELLWYSEIEQLSVPTLSIILGLNTEQATTGAATARLEFRRRWLQEQLHAVGFGEQCREQLRSLTAAVHPVDREMHIPRCVRCSIVVAESQNLTTHLHNTVLNSVLGIDGGRSYRAVLQWSEFSQHVDAGRANSSDKSILSLEDVRHRITE